MTRDEATEIVAAVLSAHKRLKLGTPIIVNNAVALVRVLSKTSAASLTKWFASAGATAIKIDTTFDEWSVQFKLAEQPRVIERNGGYRR